jgi:hypothetical protein
MISRSGAENQNSNRSQVREMTTPRIVIPADLMARVDDTRSRKTAEAQQAIEQTTSGISKPTIAPRPQQTTLITAADVTDDVIAAAIEVFEMWHDDGEPIDWYMFFDRLELTYRLLIVDLDSAASRKIQRAVRDHRKAGE